VLRLMAFDDGGSMLMLSIIDLVAH